MVDITQNIFQYLEAKRHLWNIYFINKVNSLRDCSPLDEYEEIDRLLFSALVLKELGRSLPDGLVFGRDIIPFLKIMPAHGIDRFNLMITDPRINSYVKWNEPVEITISNDIEFIFIELFEWDRYNFVSYPYYLAKITKCDEHPDFKQQNCLIETCKSRVFYSD